MNSNIEVLLKDATPWYLQIVSRYEHFHSIIHGRKEYVRYDAGTSSESKNVVVIR